MSPLEPLIGSGIALLLAAAGCLALYVTRSNRERLRFQLALFLVALALRFALSIVIYQTDLKNVLGDDDSSGWINGASYLDAWNAGGGGLLDLPAVFLGAFEGINRGYSCWLAIFFYVTGAPYRLSAAALGCFCGALTVVVTYRMACALRATPRAATRVGWWTCLFPSMLIWSAQTVKEPFVILLEVLAIYGCVRMRVDRFSVRHILLCSASIVLLMTLRFYAAYLTGAAVVIALALPRRGGRRRPIVSAILVAAVVTILLSRIGVLARHEAVMECFDRQHVQDFRHGLAATANTGFATDFDTRTPGGLLTVLSIGWIYLLLAPLPWQLGTGSLRLLLTMPEQLVWWPLFFVGVLPGLVDVIRRRLGDVLPMLLFILGLGLLYSVISGNVGLMYRQRAQLLPYLLIFAALGLERWALRRDMTRRTQRGLATGVLEDRPVP